MNLDIRHLKLIVAVTEEKSLTKAGERLHLTQSALSHQLRDIEERLGAPLFFRLNKKMILTQAGERLLHSARQVLEELKRAEDDLKQMCAGQHGMLRLSTECYTCYHWLPELFRDFSLRYPDVEVKILAESTHDPLPALLNGKIDLAIVSTEERDKRLHYKPLFQDELVAIMPPGHALADRPYLRARDFVGQHLILYVGPKDSHLYQHVLIPAGVSPARLTQMQLTEAIVELVKAGIGIGVLARWVVQEQLDAGTLIARSVTKNGLRRRWHAAFLKNDFVPAFMHDFIELLSRPAMPMATPGITRLTANATP
ncbi:MAG: LysR family transcriptional regulator [Acidobacteria bacterium]|nr:LysR family transcriptional regulator [Acidobacteriota bacterium]